MTPPPEADVIVESLRNERTVDIVTTGRKSGLGRTTEIWTTVLDGEVFITGTPNASREGVERAPRDWLANLIANPALVVCLKTSIEAELPATAAVVADPAERERVLSSEPAAWYREHSPSWEAVLQHSPLVRLTFTGPAAWLNDAI